VLRAFLDRLEPLRVKLGPLMFQFGFLNRKMVPAQAEFLDKLGAFAGQLPKDHVWCIETRNPNYLNASHFDFLQGRRLAHVFLQGYYMPPIFGVYDRFADKLADNVVIRLRGPDREGMEERTGNDWSRKLVEPRDADLDALATLARNLKARRRTVWLMVNNHFEGSAPLTIERIRARLQ
jgi:uncharacterized protein YecE (DUF72 family)